MHEGPRPIITVIILLCCIILMGVFFAAIKVFLIPSNDIVQEDGSIDVTFCPTQACEQRLLLELGNSSVSSCAFYELNLEKVIGELNNKHTSLAIYDQNIGKLSNITFKAVPSLGLMHDKFCVLDPDTNPRITTGSMNPTINDAQLNDNNLLVIHSRTLAQRYQQEFDEIASRTNVNYHKNSAQPLYINLNGTMIEQRFCPQEECEKAIMRRIDTAQHEVDFMIFTFTSDPIGDRLVAAHQRGVVIQGVMEKRQISQYAERDKLLANNIDVRLDGNSNTMHHKVFIIDNQTVITGSFNPTQGANEENDENLLIIDNPTLAIQYHAEYERVLSAATK